MALSKEQIKQIENVNVNNFSKEFKKEFQGLLLSLVGKEEISFKFIAISSLSSSDLGMIKYLSII